MDEHHWKFKVASERSDQLRAVRGQGLDYARVEVRASAAAEWDIWTGPPVAEEILRLATENEEQRTRITLLEASEVRIVNDAIEAAHDLSVKLEFAEARVAELEVEVLAKEATIHMAVARLGGEVEGAPTRRINFLQRIDELREIERIREEDPLS